MSCSGGNVKRSAGGIRKNGLQVTMKSRHYFWLRIDKIKYHFKNISGFAAWMSAFGRYEGEKIIFYCFLMFTK